MVDQATKTVLQLSRGRASVRMGSGTREFTDRPSKPARVAAEEFLTRVAHRQGTTLDVQVREGSDKAGWKTVTYGDRPADAAPAPAADPQGATPSEPAPQPKPEVDDAEAPKDDRSGKRKWKTTGASAATKGTTKNKRRKGKAAGAATASSGDPAAEPLAGQPTDTATEPGSPTAPKGGPLSRGRRQVGGASAALASRLRPATGRPGGLRKGGSDGRLVLLGLVALAVVALLAIVMLFKTAFGGHDTPAPAAAPSGSSPNGCFGGPDPVKAALAARGLASSSTITQGNATAPSPRGAEEAAGAFARLRSNFSVPGDATSDQMAQVFKRRNSGYRGILAPNATPAAKQLISARQAKGYDVHLDMTKARVMLVSGNGQKAGIDMLLSTVGTGPRNAAEPTKDVGPVGPTQVAVHLDLTVVNGQWRLQNVGSPTSSATTLAKQGTTYTNAEECSK